MNEKKPDPIAECHRLGITIQVDSTDTIAALDAWDTADEAEIARVLVACLETSNEIRNVIEPFAIQRLARERAAKFALAANRRMELHP